MSRLLIPLIALATAVSAAPATAATVNGPAGLRISKPPAKVTCPPDWVTVSVRFTAASKRRGVRAARVVVFGGLGEPVRKTIRAKRGRLRSARMAAPCGTTFTLRVEALRRNRKVIARRAFRITSSTGPGAPTGPSGEPSGPPPGAQAGYPGTSTVWTAVVDVRRSGPRDGQTCVQVSATTVDNRRLSASVFCGLLSEDPFVARTQVITDPDGARRLVLAGAAGLAAVASVSVISPAGTQQLALSPERETPGSGGGFIAVFDSATLTVEDLTLVVTLTDGTSQSYLCSSRHQPAQRSGSANLARSPPPLRAALTRRARGRRKLPPPQ